VRRQGQGGLAEKHVFCLLSNLQLARKSASSHCHAFATSAMLVWVLVHVRAEMAFGSGSAIALGCVDIYVPVL